MNIYSLSIPLQVTAEHSARLKSLQETFALVCNALAPVVQETRCWNRVALHHMMYKTLREKFPQLGSQMVCNAIYSVSRTSRLIFQSNQSPFNIQLLGNKPLPLLQFLPSAPVYFDRHTLSLKAGSLSMYTLDGRMRFELNMKEDDLNRFKTLKLHEVVLKSVNDQFTLTFSLTNEAAISKTEDLQDKDAFLPEYVVLDQGPLRTDLPETAPSAPSALSPKSSLGKPSLATLATFAPLHSKALSSAPASLALSVPLKTKPSLGQGLQTTALDWATTQSSNTPKTLGVQLQLKVQMNAKRPQYTTAVPVSIAPIPREALHRTGANAVNSLNKTATSPENQALSTTEPEPHMTPTLGATP